MTTTTSTPTPETPEKTGPVRAALDEELTIEYDPTISTTVTSYEVNRYMDGSIAIMLYSTEGLHSTVSINLGITPEETINPNVDITASRVFWLNHDVNRRVIEHLEKIQLITPRPDIPAYCTSFVAFPAYEWLGQMPQN